MYNRGGLNQKNFLKPEDLNTLRVFVLLAGSEACLAGSEACLACSEACLAGSKACLAGSEA